MKIQGSIVALVTPMKGDGSIDWLALESLLEWHISEGTNAVVSVGTTGESPTLAIDEHLDVIRRTIDVVAGRIPVIAGTGANCTREACELTTAAAKSGANATLQVVPYYNKPTQEGMFQHFSKIASSVDIPVILYNVPGRTVADLLPETIARLALVPNIIGVKEATGDMERARRIRNLCPDDFQLFSGDDPTALECFRCGASGDISVTANVAPALMSQMCAAAISGRIDEAARLDERLQPLHHALFVEPNPIPTKWALAEMGKIEAGIRLPLTELSATGVSKLRPVLQQMGLID